MNVKANPIDILNYKITFFGKRGFSTLIKAEKFTIKNSRMKKARTFIVKVEGRRSKKKVTEVVLQAIHKIESQRSYRRQKYERKVSSKKLVTEVFKPYDFKAAYFEQTFFSKKLGFYIQSNKLRYSYNSKFLIDERNYLATLKTLYKVVEMAAQDFFFDQNASLNTELKQFSS